MKKSTQKQREQLMRLLKEDKLGARSIDTIKPSDAKEWALRMKDMNTTSKTQIDTLTVTQDRQIFRIPHLLSQHGEMVSVFQYDFVIFRTGIKEFDEN